MLHGEIRFKFTRILDLAGNRAAERLLIGGNKGGHVGKLRFRIRFQAGTGTGREILYIENQLATVPAGGVANLKNRSFGKAGFRIAGKPGGKEKRPGAVRFDAKEIGNVIKRLLMRFGFQFHGRD